MTAEDREELVAAFDSALAHVPGLWVAFTQPLAMRLDEAESRIRTNMVRQGDRPGPRGEPAPRRGDPPRGGGHPAADVSVEISEGTEQIRMEMDRDAFAATVSPSRRCATHSSWRWGAAPPPSWWTAPGAWT